MASVDGAKSFLQGSEEVYENHCEPCESDGIVKEGKHYCPECKEYLCDACREFHRKLKITKHHKIVSAHDLGEHGTFHLQSHCKVYCVCSQRNLVEVYCEEHGQVICHSCKNIKHFNCRTTSLSDKSDDYTIGNLVIILEKLTSLEKKTEQLQNERKEELQNLENMKQVCREKIKSYRREVDILLDILEKNIFKDLDEHDMEQKCYIEKHVSMLSTTLEMVSTDQKLLEDVISGGEKEMMFASDILVSKSLSEYKAVLAEIMKQSKQPALKFTGNMHLINLLRENGTLGTLEEIDSTETRGHLKMFVEQKIQSSYLVNVRHETDQKSPAIDGLTFLKDGRLLVCDRLNKKLKCLSSSLDTIIDHICLEDLYDVSKIDENNVIVSGCTTKQLHYIELCPKMQIRRTVEMHSKCYGIVASDDEIFVACHGINKGEVWVLDMNGSLMRKIGFNNDGSSVFIAPLCIAVNRRSNRLYVSDDRSRAVMCLRLDGGIIYQHKMEGQGWPLGIYFDREDNILVCDNENNNVHIITGDGRYHSTLITPESGLDEPGSIGLHEGTLVIGCFSNDNLFCFKLN